MGLKLGDTWLPVVPKPWSSLAFLTRQIWSEPGQSTGNLRHLLGDGALSGRPPLWLGAQLWRPLLSPERALSERRGLSRRRGDRWLPPRPPLRRRPARAASSPAPRPDAAGPARPAHRDSVLERDALQRVAGADAVLHMALADAGAQRRPHAGRAAVRAGLGAGQAQRQRGLLGLGAGARARRRGGRRGPGRAGAALPQGRRGRGIRHGSCGGRQVGQPAKGGGASSAAVAAASSSSQGLRRAVLRGRRAGHGGRLPPPRAALPGRTCREKSETSFRSRRPPGPPPRGPGGAHERGYEEPILRRPRPRGQPAPHRQGLVRTLAGPQLTPRLCSASSTDSPAGARALSPSSSPVPRGLPPLPDYPNDLKGHVTDNTRTIKHTQLLHAHRHRLEGPRLSTLHRDGYCF